MRITFELLAKTSNAWTNCVMQDFNTFLLDHAACEKKASSMAMSMISHYPDKPELISAMCDLAVEELCHFREVVKLIQNRGLQLTRDEKDPYITQLQKHVAKGKDDYFLDRLIMASVVEARGAERFSLIATALKSSNVEADQELCTFYKAIAKSEARHYTLFLELAFVYFPMEKVELRLDQWLNFEKNSLLKLAIRPALH